MPEQTIVVVASGVSGLTVVFARRHAKTPAKKIANPTVPTRGPNVERQGSWMLVAEKAETSHIKALNRTVSATGGIFSSSAFNM